MIWRRGGCTKLIPESIEDVGKIKEFVERLETEVPNFRYTAVNSSDRPATRTFNGYYKEIKERIPSLPQ